jgi:hypothetical protein
MRIAEGYVPRCQNRPMSETALIIEVAAAEPLVGPWRAQFDPVATCGVPGHITALFPFVAPDDLHDTTIDGIRRVLDQITPFEFRLTEVAEFHDVVWLRPDPVQPFRDLTAALWKQFPDHPPYLGRFEDVQPHLTVAMTEGGLKHEQLRAAIRSDLSQHLPIEAHAEALSVFVSDDSPSWERRLVLPFGG